MWRGIIAFTLKSQIDCILNKIVFAWLSATLLVAAIFFVSGCENSGTFTEEVLPKDDLIETRYTDSLPLVFNSIWLDTSDTYRADRQLFGNYIDPIFGRITAETYTEVLARAGLDFGARADLFYDSIVLKLDIESTYGRLETPQNLHIYELTESFPEDSLINSQTRLSFDSSRDLGKGYTLDLSESGVGSAQLRIRLDDELGKRLLFASADTLGSRELFLQLFKGFYIGTDPVTFLSREPGAIFTLFGSSSNTQLELHYKQREAGTQAFLAKIEPFLVSSSTPRFTHLSRTEFENSLLVEELDQPDTKQRLEFIQGGLTIKNFIKLPDLSDFGRIAISKATLVLTVDSASVSGSRNYVPPTFILPIFADENGEEVLLNGQPLLATENATEYNSSSNSYQMELSNYVQQLVNGQRENHGLILRVSGSEFRVSRAVFGGVDHPQYSPRLEITYTTLPR